MRAFDRGPGVLTGRCILVVEDDAFIAMELEDVLTARGAEVLGPVPSVGSALEALTERRPDAVLLDVNLRGTRSTPVAEAMRAAGVPFLLVTGYSRSHLDDAPLREAPIVPKPLDQERLVQALQQLLSPEG